MRIAEFTYSEFPGQDYEWTLDRFELNKINLLVGRNATGKSRTINVLNSLAILLSGERKKLYDTGMFDVVFINGDQPLHYHTQHSNGQVQREDLKRGEKSLVRRVPGSYGWIWAEELNKEIKFQVPAQDLAIVAKRDTAQHPFLDPLLEWGSAVRHFEFGKTMGHMNLGIPVKELQVPLNEKDTTQVVPIYSKGFKVYGNAFKEAIKADMAEVGYVIDDIEMRRPAHIRIESPIQVELIGVAVKERELPWLTDQIWMSQGMFRALSIIVQLNYLVMSQAATCVLVDDIGEGLDFERSCKLIGVLRDKCYNSALQLIMSTNDRFVMNTVPLEEWCYLIRNRNHVRVLNYRNAKEAFERFKVTGLNNFELLTTNFFEQFAANGTTRSIR